VNAVVSGNFLIHKGVVLFQKEPSRFFKEWLHLLRRLLSHCLSLNHFLVFPWTEVLFLYTRLFFNSDYDFSFCHYFCNSSSLISKSPDIVCNSDVLFFLCLNIFHSSFLHQLLSGLVTDSFCLILSYRLQNINSLSVYVCLNNYIPQLYQKYSPDIMFNLLTYVWNECVKSNLIQNLHALDKLAMWSSYRLHLRVSSRCQKCP
jgi:hypothetical protein